MTQLQYAGAVHEWREVRLLNDGRYWEYNGQPGEVPERFAAIVGSCSCGWQSVKEAPPNAKGQSDAQAEWCDEHVRPLLLPLARRQATFRNPPIAQSLLRGEVRRFPAGIPDAEYLVGLVALSTAVQELEGWIDGHVHKLREARVEWPAIAAALGVSEAAAKEAFGGGAEPKGRSNKRNDK
ncbi:hypothetical protein LZC95_19690 [Pendulispora brunnea]|uniref:Uncharacterized protein n=1 Tax=Pendulispora brunnea TaxID=2905690 RepID=A0ABZ2KK27_9BACT